MKRQNYYPSRLSAQTGWLANLCAKLPGYQTTLGFTTGQVAAIVADASWLIYVLSSWQGAVRSWARSTTEYVEEIQTGTGTPALPVFTAPTPPAGVVSVAAGALNRIFVFVQKIKAADGYTQSIGSDLGVVGNADVGEHPVPRFKTKVEDGQACQCVRARFFKYRHMGVYIESRRGGPQAPWEFLAIHTVSPYTDARPLLVPGQPETREYRMRFWDKGTPNGEWTDVARETVGV